MSEAPGESVLEFPPANEEWDELVRYAYEAAQRSGMREFYQTTDVAVLRYLCEAMQRSLHGAGTRSGVGMSPQMVMAVTEMMGRLGFTEGDRRRLRIELQRGEPDDAPQREIMSKYRSGLKVIGGTTAAR